MLRKVVEYFFSFGFMALGLIFLLLSSVIFSPVRGATFYQFPASGFRVAGYNHISNGGNLPASRPAAPRLKSNVIYSASSTAIASLVLDTRSKTVLYSKNADETRPLASITKLITALVLVDLPINWTSTTVITSADVENGGDHHVQVGEWFKLDHLWHIALVGSSNAATNALVRTSGLSTEQFVELMNKKARELGLHSLRFVEPTGLSEQNVGNPADVAALLMNALQFEKIYTTLQTTEYAVRPLNGRQARRVWNTNWLLTNWVPNSFAVEDIAGKTGYITSSRYNFAVGISDKRRYNITVVVLGAASNEERFSEARDLAEWVFANYVWPDEEGYQRLTGA